MKDALLTGLVCAALMPALGCVDEGGGTTEPAQALLPDGTTGTVQVGWGGSIYDLPFVVRDGQKQIDDDWAIGPALADAGGAHPLGAFAINLTKWTDRHVPYCVQIYDAVHNPMGLTAGAGGEEGTVDQALADIATVTPLVFDKHACSFFGPTDEYIDYIHWTKTYDHTDAGDNGHPGNTIHLAATFSGGTIEHETGHAIGMFHEARRSDRNYYVNYYSQCVDNSVDDHSQAFLQNAPGNDQLLSPYDQTSIMEYSSFSFSVDKAHCPTLLYDPDPDGLQTNDDDGHAPQFDPAGGGSFWGTVIPKHDGHYSAEDINAVYQVYEPKLGDAETSDRLGGAVVAGDFDGDGYQDLAVGATGEGPHSTIRSGAVFVYKGTMNGLVEWRELDETDFYGTTPQSSDGFGTALAAGDLDGDGADELIVGAPAYGSARGGAFFVYGGDRRGPIPLSPGPYSQTSLGVGTSLSGDRFGAALAVGTFGGDGARYLAVGAPSDRATVFATARGSVDVLRWNGTGFGGWQHLTAPTPHDGDQYGYALAAGDLSVDGVDDLVVGAAQTGTGAGFAVPYFGHTGAMIAKPALARTSPATGDRFGQAVAIGAGHAPSVPIVAVGAPGRATGAGRAYTYVIFSGSMVSVDELKQSDLSGQTGHANDAFGSALAVGDLDGDGTPDVVVGVPSKDNGTVDNAGAVFVFRSNATDKVIAATSPQTFDAFGGALALGNFNAGAKSVVGDGHLDLAVGLPGRNVGTATAAGVVDTYLGGGLGFWRQLTEQLGN